MVVYIFLGLLVLLFGFNAITLLPLEKPLDLAKEGSADLTRHHGRWYVLDAGTYSVDARFGSVRVRSSFLMFYSNEYTYYCVTVNPGSENAFSMPVRVKSSKRQRLENGETVSFYGMGSELTGNLRPELEKVAAERKGNLCYLCLNDNGDTIATRWLSSVAFTLLAGFCIFVIIKLARR